MDHTTEVNGIFKLMKKMDSEFKYGKMVLNISDIGVKIKLMASED